ncbi:MAG TPA: hypothetical protein VK171_04265 [Fimbriimonas sp.]|nr:hypothetical protein [Fimbriimonas sp.]
MNRLLPFRPWRFAEAGSLSPALVNVADPEPFLENSDSVLHLAGFERKSDDRSPFVRYARGAATWNRWVQHGVVVQDAEPSLPVIEGFKYGLAPVSSLRSSTSIKPAVREHYQRILEGTQIYFEPIVVAADDLTVIGNTSLYHAAVEMYNDFARPGKVRASDYALVAIAPSGWEEQVSRNWIEVPVKAVNHEQLTALSPRTEDLCLAQVRIGTQTFFIDSKDDENWLAKLTGALGVSTLNLNLKVTDAESVPSDGVAWILPPLPYAQTLGTGEQFPFDSFSNNNVPDAGAILWNLRDFRPE